MRKRPDCSRLHRVLRAASAGGSEEALVDLAALHLKEAIADTRRTRKRLERALRQLGR